MKSLSLAILSLALPAWGSVSIQQIPLKYVQGPARQICLSAEKITFACAEETALNHPLKSYRVSGVEWVVKHTEITFKGKTKEKTETVLLDVKEYVVARWLESGNGKPSRHYAVIVDQGEGAKIFSQGVTQETVSTQWGTFDPLQEAGDVSLPGPLWQKELSTAVLLQYQTAPQIGYRELLEQLGGHEEMFMRGDAEVWTFKTAQDAEEARKLPFVRSVMPWPAALKLPLSLYLSSVIGR